MSEFEIFHICNVNFRVAISHYFFSFLEHSVLLLSTLSLWPTISAMLMFIVTLKTIRHPSNTHQRFCLRNEQWKVGLRGLKKRIRCSYIALPCYWPQERSYHPHCWMFSVLVDAFSGRGGKGGIES